MSPLSGGFATAMFGTPSASGYDWSPRLLISDLPQKTAGSKHQPHSLAVPLVYSTCTLFQS